MLFCNVTIQPQLNRHTSYHYHYNTIMICRDKPVCKSTQYAAIPFWTRSLQSIGLPLDPNRLLRVRPTDSWRCWQLSLDGVWAYRRVSVSINDIGEGQARYSILGNGIRSVTESCFVGTCVWSVEGVVGTSWMVVNKLVLNDAKPWGLELRLGSEVWCNS